MYFARENRHIGTRTSEENGMENIADDLSNELRIHDVTDLRHTLQGHTEHNWLLTLLIAHIFLR